MPDRIIKRLNGARGSVLLFSALFCLVHMVSCLPPGTSSTLPAGLELLGDEVPLTIYAALWGVAAVLCTGAAYRRRDRSVRVTTDVLAFSIVAGATFLWSGVYLLGWLFDPEPNRQWVFAASYAAIAGLLTAASRMVNPGVVR